MAMFIRRRESNLLFKNKQTKQNQDFKSTFFEFSGQTTIVSRVLLFQLWTAVGVGAGFLLSPHSPVANPVELGGETTALAIARRIFGSNVIFSLAPALYVLLSAANRNRLSASTFRNLLVGCGVSMALVNNEITEAIP